MQPLTPPDQEHTPRPSWESTLLGALLVLIPVFLFWPTLIFSFLNWDDVTYILANPWLRNLSWDHAAGVFQHPYFSNWHPLTMLVYMGITDMFGHEPWAFRIVNMVLHGMVGALAFAWLQHLGCQRWLALAGVILFLVHPLRVESVVWISETKDGLSSFFYLLALAVWSEPRPDKGRRWPSLIAVFLAAVLALLSKPMAITLPAVLALHELLIRRERTRHETISRWALVVLLALLAAACVRLNIDAQQNAIRAETPVITRVAMAVTAPLFYAVKTVLPIGLSPLYPTDNRWSQSPVIVAAAVLFCGGLLLVALRNLRRRPLVAFALLAAPLALAPVSGIVAFGSAFAADRYSYLPTLLLLPALAAIPAVRNQRLAAGLLTAAAIACILATTSYQQHWSSSDRLWERVLSLYPKSSHAQLNLSHAQSSNTSQRETSATPGSAAEPAGSRPGHLEELETAIRAHQLAAAGEWDAAIAMSRRIGNPSESLFEEMRIQLKRPDYEGAAGAARQLIRRTDVIPENRSIAAGALAQVGDEATALAILEGLGQPTLGASPAYGLLAHQARERGDHEQALALARKGLAIFPAEHQAVEAAAETLLSTNRRTEAVKLLRRAVRHSLCPKETRLYGWRRLAELEGNPELRTKAYEGLSNDLPPEPKDSNFLHYAGSMAEQDRFFELAEELYRMAIRANPKNPAPLQDLAFIRIAQGKKADALQLMLAAQELAPGDADLAHNIDRLRQELAE